MPSNSRLDAAYLHIRQQIEGGVIRPGQRLSRRKLAEEIGVSSALVQHAIAQLDREGITESRARSGTYVRELTQEEFSNLCDVRELVEPYAAACAAQRITSTELQILKESCERHQQLYKDRRWIQHAATAWLHRCATIREELVFHGTILKASGNQILANLVSTLRMLAQVSPGLIYENGQDKENSPLLVTSEHEGIIEALEAHDPELARARMFNHIRGARILICQPSPSTMTAHQTQECP